MKFIRKYKGYLITYLIITITYLVSLVLLTFSFSVLTGIETLIRSGILILFYLFALLYIIFGIKLIKKKKRIKFIIISVLLCLVIPINIIVSHYIDKTYNVIASIKKEKITYTTVLVNLSSEKFINEAKTKIGMITDESDITGYILAYKLINKNKLNDCEIVKYETYLELIQALYNKEVSAIFLADNYTTLFSEEVGFESIANDTKIVYKYSETLNKDEEITSTKSLNEPFTVLLMGVDSTIDGLTKNQSFNGDALIVITFNPHTLNATILSIPRDTYVPIVCRNNKEAKIASAAYSGATCMIKTIEKLTDVNIDYYAKMNFTGIVDLVNALGGINVDVPYKFCEQNSKREFGNNAIYLNAGYQKLNGEEALALSRNRKYHAECSSEWNTGNRNDFIRGQNQQLVVEAILKEIKNLRNINQVYSVLEAVSNNLDTNINTKQIFSFYDTLKDIVTKTLNGNDDFINIEKLYLQTKNLYILGSSTEQYQKKSLNAVTKAMKVNLELETAEAIKTFNFDVNEPYEFAQIGKGLYDNTMRSTLPNFVGQNKTEATTWANTNGKSVLFETISLTDSLYDSTKESGTIVAQSVRAQTLIENVKSITFKIIP